MRELPSALAAMLGYRQFIAYKLQPSSRPGKTDKLPIDPKTGKMPPKGDGGAHDSSIWTDFHTAAEAVADLGPGYGVGFVFTDTDPFWFIDVDDCLKDGQWSPTAVTICQQFAGAAVEISSSGSGLHLFGCGTVPSGHACKNINEHLELYTTGRFVALTGVGAVGDISTDHTTAMQRFVDQWMRGGATPAPVDWTDGPCDDWAGVPDNDQLVARACASTSAAAAFGGKVRFKQLWDADVEALAKHYPHPSNAYDASSADSALAQHLAFWTGNDCERIQTLMMQSALVRPKWDREDYLRRTILRAVSRQKTVYRQQSPALEAAPVLAVAEPLKVQIASAGTPDELKEIASHIRSLRLSPADFGALVDAWRKQYNLLTDSAITRAEAKATLQASAPTVGAGELAWLTDWVYLAADERFFSLSTGEAIGQQAFNNRFARNCPRNEMGGRIPASTVAFDMVGIPVCYQTMYAPQFPAMFEADGIRYVNSFIASRLPPAAAEYTAAGTAAINRVIEHLRHVVSYREDQLRLIIDWLAHNVQFPGVKIRFAPLIKGIEGSGKTFFWKLLQLALGRNVKGVSIQELTSDFNAFATGACVRVMEEIRLSGHNKHEIVNKIKPLITNDDATVIAKQKSGIDILNVTNYIALTNFEDAVPLDDNSRRWWVLFMPWWDKSAMDAALGGSDRYFGELFESMCTNGPEICKWLREWQIGPEFNPNAHAPWTEEAGRMASASRHALDGIVGDILAESGAEVAYPLQLATEINLTTDIGQPVNAEMVTCALKRLGWSMWGRTRHQGKRYTVWVRSGYVTIEMIRDGLQSWLGA